MWYLEPLKDCQFSNLYFYGIVKYLMNGMRKRETFTPFAIFSLTHPIVPEPIHSPLHCSCCKDLDWKVNRTFFMYYLVTPSAESLWCYYTITVPFAFCLLINLSPFITCSQPICAALYSLDVIFVSGQDNEKEPSMCLLCFDYVCSNWILNLQWMIFILVWNGILEFWYVIM